MGGIIQWNAYTSAYGKPNYLVWYLNRLNVSMNKSLYKNRKSNYIIDQIPINMQRKDDSYKEKINFVKS